MGNTVVINSKKQAEIVLSQHKGIVSKNDVRLTVKNSLEKLNDVNVRIEKVEKKGFFRRMVGGVTGKNQKELVSVIRDISEIQNMTIQLVLSLAIVNSQNQNILREILVELENSKGKYPRIIDNIEFLYDQVMKVKESQIGSEIIANKTRFKFKGLLAICVIITIALVIFISVNS